MTDSLPVWLKRIEEEWSLEAPLMAALCHVELSRYQGWLSESHLHLSASIPPGMEPCVPLVAIFKKLQKLVPAPEDQIRWLTTPNSAFDGNPPFEIMKSSPSNLAWVAYILDSQSKT
jgi:hypothetical protein